MLPVGDGLEEADEIGISAEINGRGSVLRYHEGVRPASKPGCDRAAKSARGRLSSGTGEKPPPHPTPKRGAAINSAQIKLSADQLSRNEVEECFESGKGK